MIHCDCVKATICVAFLAVISTTSANGQGDFPDTDRNQKRAVGEDEESMENDQSVTGQCPFLWRAVGDYCYLYVKQPGMQWTQAEQYCSEMADGAHLASLRSKDDLAIAFALISEAGTHWYHSEHQAYHSFSASNDYVWVGLSYMCPEPNGGRWSDGSRLTSDTKVDEQSASSSSPLWSYSYSSSSTIGNTRGKQRCVGYHLTPQGGRLVKASCLDYAPFLCKMHQNANSTMMKDGMEEENGTDTNQCGGYDWCYSNGSCFKLLSKDQSWYEARSACQLDGGDLVSIHSVSDIDYINNNLTGDWSAGSTVWTGLNKLESIDDRYQWSDNTPVDFLPAVTVEMKSGMTPRSSSCVSMKLSHLRRLLSKSRAAGKMRVDEELQLSRCDSRRPAVCRKPVRKVEQSPVLTTPSPSPAVGGCPKGWLLFQNRCYRAFGVDNASISERANFREAAQTCAKHKSGLVSIQNTFDNLFVFSLLTNDDLNQSWIGLIYNDGRLRWLDETEVTYTNFDQLSMATFGMIRNTPAPAVPSRSVSGSSYYRSEFDDYPGLSGAYSSSSLWKQHERCFVISIDKAPGTWDPVSSSGSLESMVSRVQPSTWTAPTMTRGKRSVYWPYDWRRSWAFSGESCEQLKLPFVCEKSKSANETSGENEWLCDEDKSRFKHGSACFEIVQDAPRNWDDARKYCENSSKSSTLTSILTQQEFAFLVSVMKKRRDLEQFWIGMRVTGEDNTTSVHSEWVDKWPVWITKWDRNPIADQDRQCVVMRAQNEQSIPNWHQDWCDKKLPFICKHRNNAETPPRPAVAGRCEHGWIAGSTLCYKIKKDEWTSGANAMLRCWREHNATLASFPTETDWHMISKSQDLKEAKRRFFIGLIQKVQGDFQWIDGSPLEFVNWAPQEPRFGWNPSVEVCVEMDQNGLWYDAGCHETRHFICSKPKEEEEGSLVELVSPSPEPSVITKATSSARSQPTTTPTTSAPVGVTDNGTIAGNQSDNGGQLISPLGSLQRTKGGNSRTGVVAGIVVCAVFVLVLVSLALVYLYRRHTQGLPLFRRRSSDAMRFEILNENHDDY